MGSIFHWKTAWIIVLTSPYFCPTIGGHLSVHCRTGSLEILDNGLCVIAEVHCRTGSLEKHYGLSAKQAATVFQSAAKYERIYQRRMENAKNTIDSDG